MDENFIGMCIECHLPIYIDEGYKVVENKFDGFFMKFICEECLQEKEKKSV